MDDLVLNDFHFERQFCPRCDSFQWHIEKEDGTWDCLNCRVRGLEEVYPQSTLPPPYQTIPAWKLKGAYEKLPRQRDFLPMPPSEGPPLPRMLTIKWPWRK